MTTAIAASPANKYTAAALAQSDAPKAIAPQAAYVNMAWEKTKNKEVKAALKAAGADPDDAVVIYVSRAGVTLPLKPFRFHLLDLRTFATRIDNNGKPDAAALKVPLDPNGKPLNKWDEHTFALIVTYMGDQLVPAVADFRGQRRRAINNAVTAYADCQTGGWRGRPGCAAAADCPFPAGRFVATGSLRAEKSQQSGNDFITGTCTINPTTAEQAVAFMKAMNDPQFLADLTATEAAFNRKVNALLEGNVEDAEILEA